MTYKTDWTIFIRRYLIAVIGVSLLILGAQQLFDHNLNSSGATVVPIILASMLEGRDFARSEGRAPSGGWAWQQSLAFGLIGVAVSMGISAFFMGAVGGSLGELLTPIGFASFTMVTGLMTIIFILGARLFFHMGAHSELKMRKRDKD